MSASETKGLAVWLAQGRSLGKDDDACVIIAEPQLACRTQHAIALKAEDRLGLDHPSIGHGGAGRGERDHVARLHIERATPHVSLAPVADVHVDPMDLGGIRMTFCAHDASRDDTDDSRPDVDDLFDRQAEVGHRLGDLVDLVTERGQFVEP